MREMENNEHLLMLRIDIDEINKLFNEIDEARRTINQAVRKLSSYKLVQVVGTIDGDSPEEP